MNNINKTVQSSILRGELYYADLSPVVGSEQGGIRPVLIIQNNMGNKHSPTVIVAAITSKTTKALIPTHVNIPSTPDGLKQDSTVLTEQVRTIDKKRLREYIGHLSPKQMAAIDQAILTSFGLSQPSTVQEKHAPVIQVSRFA